MSALTALLVGKTLGQTIYRCIVALLLVACVGWALWSVGKGAWYAWRADVWKERAVEARDAARQASANAASADAGAANASTTRQRIDAAAGAARDATRNSATRIETHADNPLPAADRRPVAADVMRELEAGNDRVRTAADRLQRPRAD